MLFQISSVEAAVVDMEQAAAQVEMGEELTEESSLSQESISSKINIVSIGS